MGWGHPPLTGSARMIEDSPLEIGYASPHLGSVLAELQPILPAVSPAAIIALALLALDKVRDERPFSDGLPRWLGWLDWVLIAEPVWALFVALCIAYLRVQVLIGTASGREVNAAFTTLMAWPAFRAGIGVLVLRSIIIEGITMRRDVDGTV